MTAVRSSARDDCWEDPGFLATRSFGGRPGTPVRPEPIHQDPFHHTAFRRRPLKPDEPTFGDGQPGQPSPDMLIVEHEALIAMDIAETMGGIGFFGPRIAFSYEGALQEIERAVPDYAVVDIHIEARPGGESLLKLLREAGCRCVVFSADGDACRQLSAVDPDLLIVPKPAQPDRLVNAVMLLRNLPDPNGTAPTDAQGRSVGG